MKSAVVESKCECQARLGAEVDEQLRALRGWARYRHRELLAPANVIGKHGDHFNVGWACPFCMRNTLRSFDATAFSFQEKAPAATIPPGSRPSLRAAVPSSPAPSGLGASVPPASAPAAPRSSTAPRG